MEKTRVIIALFVLVIAFLLNDIPIISFNFAFNAINHGFGWFPTFSNNVSKLDRITIKVEFYFEFSVGIITAIKKWSKRINIFTTHDLIF